MARRATVKDVHRLAQSMPGVTRYPDPKKAVYQVSRKSFVFFRNPRPDAFDPETGERYDDVIVFWVESEEAKQELLADESLPFFTTPHFNGHPSVLLRGCRVGRARRGRARGGGRGRLAGPGAEDQGATLAS